MKKFWYGVLAFAPIVLIILSLLSVMLPILLIFIMGMGIGATGGEIEGALGAFVGIFITLSYGGFFIGIFCAVILNFVDIAVFCIHVAKNPKIEKNTKVMWYCMFIAMQCGIAPIYWWMYIKKE
ncbi:MAG: hypothetical protein IJZ42_09420 [Lachnospiraceae bacterium]|nr:hypothetical protein [Lachnospiraceae bacterium]